VEYDAAKRSYTIVGSGENMWLANDAFQFVWKKMSGDVTLTADIAFLGKGVNEHRKAVLMIRQLSTRILLMRTRHCMAAD